MKSRQLCVFTVAAISLARFALAQQAFYDPSNGIMCVDTGLSDIVAVFIEGPDVSQPGNVGCALCDGMNLPGLDALGESSTWTVGFSAGSTQWIRTDPLQGRGFVGSIGEFFIDGAGVQQDWPDDVPPFLDFPDPFSGIATYSTGLTGNDFGRVTFASEDGAFIETFVAVAHCDDGSPRPVAKDDSFNVPLGGVLDVPAPGVLINDFDPLGRPLFASLDYYYYDLPEYGELVSFNGDGSFVYQAPDPGTVLPGTVDTFNYMVFADYDDFDMATVSILLTVPEPSCQLLGLVLAFVIGRKLPSPRQTT